MAWYASAVPCPLVHGIPFHSPVLPTKRAMITTTLKLLKQEYPSFINARPPAIGWLARSHKDVVFAHSGGGFGTVSTSRPKEMYD